jgi:hypothetical protein
MAGEWSVKLRMSVLKIPILLVSATIILIVIRARIKKAVPSGIRALPGPKGKR